MNSQDNNFIFTSKGRALTATGVETVLSNVGLSHEQFIETVELKLNQLERQGMDNPIVMGAIPFNIRKPTHFYVPKSYKFSDTLDCSDLNHHKDLPEFKLLKPVTNENHYSKAVSKALQLFDNTRLDKVVLSRAIDVESNTQLNAEQMAKTLYQQNPNAYVFSIPQQTGGTLIGASPELLVKRQGTKVFSNPLAGSRKRISPNLDGDGEIKNELWH